MRAVHHACAEARRGGADGRGDRIRNVGKRRRRRAILWAFHDDNDRGRARGRFLAVVLRGRADLIPELHQPAAGAAARRETGMCTAPPRIADEPRGVREGRDTLLQKRLQHDRGSEVAVVELSGPSGGVVEHEPVTEDDHERTAQAPRRGKRQAPVLDEDASRWRGCSRRRRTVATTDRVQARPLRRRRRSPTNGGGVCVDELSHRRRAKSVLRRHVERMQRHKRLQLRRHEPGREAQVLHAAVDVRADVHVADRVPCRRRRRHRHGRRGRRRVAGPRGRTCRAAS